MLQPILFARALSNTLSPHFIHIISYMHSGWLKGSLTITFTGLSPVSMLQLSWTSPPEILRGD